MGGKLQVIQWGVVNNIAFFLNIVVLVNFYAQFQMIGILLKFNIILVN